MDRNGQLEEFAIDRDGTLVSFIWQVTWPNTSQWIVGRWR